MTLKMLTDPARLYDPETNKHLRNTFAVIKLVRKSVSKYVLVRRSGCDVNGPFINSTELIIVMQTSGQ